MAFAKVQRQSRSFPGRQEVHVDLNMFDLSHDYKTTFTMGKLVPFLTLPVLPADQWFIRAEVMCRFAPLYLPIFHRVNMSLDYFYVPNRIMWPLTQNVTVGAEARGGWEVFINPGDTNLGFAAQVHPYVTTLPYNTNPPNTVTGRSGELVAYMGIPTLLPGATTGAAININAFFPSAYYMTWDRWYRNDQIQDRIFTQLIAGDNSTSMPRYPIGGGAQVYNYLLCMYRNWNRDNFTSATPTPQVGSEVQVPLVDTDFMDPVTATLYGGPYRWRQQADDAPAAASDLVVGAGGPVGHTEAGATPVYLDIQEVAPSIAQLRYSLMLQEYLERALRAGDEYPDFMEKFFGVNPFSGVIQKPEWLGSKRGRVVISEVMSTTETATLKVGNYAGQALALESTDDTITLRAKEHGVLLGIISIYPDSSYMQGLERMWTYELQTDYPWEQFALIGDQAILNKEVNLLWNTVADPDYNDEVFGYNRRYHEWMYKNDLYTGMMRNTFISFHLGRLLSITSPESTVLDSLFIECRPDITRAFQVASYDTPTYPIDDHEDEIYAHIYNDIKVRRRLPKQGIPAV